MRESIFIFEDIKMGNAKLDTKIFDKAAAFAIKAHGDSERRGHGTPYALHVFEASAICETITKDQEILAAALLHDTLEDTDVTYDELIKEFGERVANLVYAETDKFYEGDSEESSWTRRKQEAIDRIKQASKDVKIIAMGDKLSNMRAIARDFEVQGDALWNIFHNNDPLAHEWHYRGLADSLDELRDTAAYREFVYLIDKTFSKYHK